MRKKLLLVFNTMFLVMLVGYFDVKADIKKNRSSQPFGRMQSRKPLFGVKDGKEAFPIRPVIKLTSQYHELRNIKVVAQLRSKKWVEAESFFDVPAYKTAAELLIDKKLIKECGECFGLKPGTFTLKGPIKPEHCIRLIELKSTVFPKIHKAAGK